MAKLAFFLTILLSFGSLVAEGYEWLPEGSYDSSIPTPESVLGYEIGTRLTDHYPMLDYFQRLQEAAPDRVKLIRFGESVEGRPMILAIISSPDNMQRLEEIRTAMARLTDPRKIEPSDVESIVTTTPPIGWMNYANDGGETAAFEAGIQVAYQLAAGSDPLTLKIRDNVVTIVNPAANPDSHQWFATWMRATTVGPNGTADPHASEHNVPWFISSDGNHYLIDSNRDAFALTQVETRAIARMLQHWNPQVWIDNHGEPEEYTFAPFTSPVNFNYPASHLKWATEIGRNSARYFDRQGWSYSKDETYDLYYPGYWDSYPGLNGAVPATYETNGGGWKNLSWEKADGSLSTLRAATHGHFIADLATLETLADHREPILRDFHAFFADALKEAEREEFKTYILFPENDSARLNDLIELLLRHGFEIYRTRSPISGKKIQTYLNRRSSEMEVPAGSYLLPLHQPRKRLLKTLFEPDPKMEEKFLQGVEERRSQARKLGPQARRGGREFYDVTAWALPLTYGLLAGFSEVALPVSQAERVEQAAIGGRMVGGPAAAAYLVPWSDGGACIAGRLLQSDYRVAIATRPFHNSGRDYDKGTVIVRVGRNPESLHDRITELSLQCDAEAFAVDTGWAERGVSLGSRNVVNLKRPQILVMSGEPTRAVAYGGVYSLLEQRLGFEFTTARAEYFSEIDLTRYNSIVFPDGSAAGYLELLGKEGVDRLRRWIREGGTFVGLRGGAQFATLSEVELGDVVSGTQLPLDNEAGDGEEGAREPIEAIPGSIFRAQLNRDYYLGYGYPQEIPVQFSGNRVYSPTRSGANVVTFADNSFLQGHRWEDTEAELSGTAYLADIPVGEGHVILFADDPAFRGYWRGLDRLIAASLILSPAF